MGRFDPLSAHRTIGQAGLSRRVKAVLRVLVDHSDSAGRSWPSVQRLADLSGYTKPTVIGAIRDAEALGWLLVERGSGRRSSRYDLRIPNGGGISTGISTGSRSGKDISPHASRSGKLSAAVAVKSLYPNYTENELILTTTPTKEGGVEVRHELVRELIEPMAGLRRLDPEAFTSADALERELAVIRSHGRTWRQIREAIDSAKWDFREADDPFAAITWHLRKCKLVDPLYLTRRGA